jgi:hypothetical protein
MIHLAESKKAKFPWSPFREEETLTFGESDKIEIVRNKITSGLFFKSPDDIFVEQACEYVNAWINGDSLPKINLKTKSILESKEDKNAWINQQPVKDTEDWHRLKNNTVISRKNVRENILLCDEFLDSKVFSRKRGREGIRSYVDYQHSKYLQRIKDIQNNMIQFLKMAQLREPSLRNEFLSRNVSGKTLDAMINFIRYMIIEGIIIKKKGRFDHENLNRQVHGFLNSNYFKELPILKIEYYILAALARKVHSGQKNLNNIHTDIESIANYLPYCDAILIDKECASLLDEKVIKTDLAYNSRIFSTKTKEDFLQCLRQLS